MWRLARLIYAGRILEKKLAKKNVELLEVRDFRKKLDDKEKEICSAIEKIQNQKIEIIFEKGMQKNFRSWHFWLFINFSIVSYFPTCQK